MATIHLPFVKYHGTGNDFIVVDGVNGVGASFSDEQYSHWCMFVAGYALIAKKIADRHFGIGGDQILLLRKATLSTCDAVMAVYNNDGSRAEMCGNGVRCAAKYWYDRVLNRDFTKRSIRFETLAGVIICDIIGEGSTEYDDTEVRVAMGKPLVQTGDELFHLTVAWNGVESVPVTAISMGNPHCVVLAQHLPSSPTVAQIPLHEIGKLIEHNEYFPNRTNVEFVESVDSETVRMRVWERGAGETLSCGTGACATGVASILRGLVPSNKVNVLVPGGRLTIEWRDGQVFKQGPASFVFEGVIALPQAIS